MFNDFAYLTIRAHHRGRDRAQICQFPLHRVQITHLLRDGVELPVEEPDNMAARTRAVVAQRQNLSDLGEEEADRFCPGDKFEALSRIVTILPVAAVGAAGGPAAVRFFRNNGSSSD